MMLRSFLTAGCRPTANVLHRHRVAVAVIAAPPRYCPATAAAVAAQPHSCNVATAGFLMSSTGRIIFLCDVDKKNQSVLFDMKKKIKNLDLSDPLSTV